MYKFDEEKDYKKNTKSYDDALYSFYYRFLMCVRVYAV